MAISHLGQGQEISNVDTERTAEALACRRFYDIALASTLRDVDWPFARKTSFLGLIETFSSSTSEWTYSYRYPSDCVRIRRIKSTLRNDSRQSRVSYNIYQDDVSRIIYTDAENAEAIYTKSVEDPSFYTPSFTLALSFRLAGLVAPRITKGDPFGMRKSALDMYDLEISRAKASSFNEEQSDEEVDSEFVRSRGGYNNEEYDDHC